MIKETHIVPVTVHYTFDSESPVYLCESIEEARDTIEKDFKEEIRIRTEENGQVIGKDLMVGHTKDWSFAYIMISPDNGDDAQQIEWAIGTVKDKI